jgi:hypothetical protein
MRRILSIALAALAVLGASRALAQRPEGTAVPAMHGVTWTFDAVRGRMQATPAARVVIPGKPSPAKIAAATTTSTTYTGTIDITVTVNLISEIPKGATLNCSTGAGLDYEVLTGDFIEPGTGTTSGFSGDEQINENVQVTVTGNKATCTFSIPYIWTVPASTSTTLIVVQGISGSVEISTQYSLTNGGLTTSVNRYTQVDLAGPTTMPPDGTTTSLTGTAAL